MNQPILCHRCREVYVYEGEFCIKCWPIECEKQRTIDSARRFAKEPSVHGPGCGTVDIGMDIAIKNAEIQDRDEIIEQLESDLAALREENKDLRDKIKISGHNLVRHEFEIAQLKRT